MVSWFIGRARFFLMTVHLAAIATGAFGNGGGYFTRGVDQTGMIQSFQPEGTEQVAIIQEDLEIVLGPQSTRVEVRYILRNVSEKKARVRFGFPVEEITMDRRSGSFFLAKQNGGVEKPKQLEACRDYRIELAGIPLETKFTAQDQQPDERFIGLRGWLVSEARFEKGEEKTMTIRFEADYIQSGHSVSDDSWDEAQVFKYRLSTGAAWNGPIQKGRVTVRAEGIPLAEVKIKKPLNRFQRGADGWEWRFRDLNPTLEDDLVIEAVPSIQRFSARDFSGKHLENRDDRNQFAWFSKRGERWYVEHVNYSIKASSTLANEGDKSYAANNLRSSVDVWSEGAEGSGAGEWIELRLEVPQTLESLILYSGHSDEELFAANARPHQVKINLNGEHTFEHTLLDTAAKQTIPITNYTKPVKLVRLTFLSVFEGTRYQDMCLNHLSLRSALSKEPKIQPSR